MRDDFLSDRHELHVMCTRLRLQSLSYQILAETFIHDDVEQALTVLDVLPLSPPKHASCVLRQALRSETPLSL